MSTPTTPNPTFFQTLKNEARDTGNILVFIGIFLVAFAIGLITRFPWGLLVFGIGILIWGIVNVNSRPKYRGY